MHKILNKNLSLLLGGQLASQVGDKFHMLALSFWVLKTTGSTTQMGLVLFCSFFPAFLTGFLAGAFVDRHNRKYIIVATDLIRGVVVAAVAVLFLMGHLNLILILLSQILLSFCAAFFDAAVPALIPQITPREHLSRANSLGEFIRGFANIIGPALGGMAVALFGYGAAFAVNAASYLISGGFEMGITPPARENTAPTRSSVWQDAVAGLKFIGRRRELTIILAMVAVIHFFVGSIEVIMPVLADGLDGVGTRNLGFMQTAFGIGAVLMALLLGTKSIAGSEVKLLFAAIGAFGGVCLAVAWLRFSGVAHIGGYLAAILLLGFLIIVAATSFRTLLQKSVDNRLAGRVFGAAATIGNVSIPIAMLAYGILLKHIPLGLLVMITGVGLILMSLAGYHTYGHPQRDPQPHPSS